MRRGSSSLRTPRCPTVSLTCWWPWPIRMRLPYRRRRPRMAPWPPENRPQVVVASVASVASTRSRLSSARTTFRSSASGAVRHLPIPGSGIRRSATCRMDIFRTRIPSSGTGPMADSVPTADGTQPRRRSSSSGRTRARTARSSMAEAMWRATRARRRPRAEAQAAPVPAAAVPARRAAPAPARRAPAVGRRRRSDRTPAL